MIAVAVARIAINATIPPAKITAGIATRSRSVRLDITNELSSRVSEANSIYCSDQFDGLCCATEMLRIQKRGTFGASILRYALGEHQRSYAAPRA